MATYENESWFALYHAALVELEHAKMLGRIDAARVAITARLEQLRSMPELNTKERRAIDDSWRMLRMLEDEEDQYNRDEKRRLVVEAEKKMLSIAPTTIKKAFTQE